MTDDVLTRSQRLISGEVSLDEHHPVLPSGDSTLTELGDGLAFVESFANVTALRDEDRLLLVDAGGVLHAGQVHRAIRDWTDAPLETAVYTHGHIDHVFSVPLFEAEGRSPAPRVIAHERVRDRFDRYRLTNGYNGVINQRQFQLGAPLFPHEFRYPDETYVRTWPEFIQSGWSDARAFAIANSFDAVLSHFVAAPVIGSLLGGIGAWLAYMLRRSRTGSAVRDT